MTLKTSIMMTKNISSMPTTMWLVLFVVFSNTINLVVSTGEPYYAEITVDRVTVFPMIQPIMHTQQVSPKRRITQGRGMGSSSYTGMVELPTTRTIPPPPPSFSHSSSTSKSVINIPGSILKENLTDSTPSSRFDAEEPSSAVSYDEPCPSSSPSSSRESSVHMHQQTNNTVRTYLIGDTILV
jgi:hypothetical protein